VSSVTFRGLLRVVNKEAAVLRSLESCDQPYELHLMIPIAFAFQLYLGVSCCSVYDCSDRSNVPSSRSDGISQKSLKRK